MAWTLAATQAASVMPATVACDRELRKTFEALQAWRRLHAGEYPPHIVSIKQAGLVPHQGAICPDIVRESRGADSTHRLTSSRGPALDPAGTYEYEFSDGAAWKDHQLHLPEGAPRYSRMDIKRELLRRPHYEQVPALRCTSHRGSAPAEYGTEATVFRNLTVHGQIYWSGEYWEDNWLEHVPLCARSAIVLFGLKGPPFHSDRTPSVTGTLDLRPWSNAFGDHPWWWTVPMFDEGPRRQWAAHLRPFFQENPGRSLQLGGTTWWIDGLVQLQGRPLTNPSNVYREPGRLAFPWQRSGLPLPHRVQRATWLQGTVWTAPERETVGWLVWQYQDGSSLRVPIVYGETTARFWADPEQVLEEQGFASPVWRHAETAAAVGRDRELRLYRQSWINPHPDSPLASLDFVSNRESPAAPFLIALRFDP